MSCTNASLFLTNECVHKLISNYDPFITKKMPLRGSKDSQLYSKTLIYVVS